MEKITVDEQNKKRIQKYIKQATGLLFGYEEDIALLEHNNELTESLARKAFIDIMKDAHRIRNILTPEEKDEFEDLIEETFSKYDTIPKPELLDKYGFNDGSYKNMELEDVYSNMKIAFEVKELDSKYYGCRDLRNIADSVINSINEIEKYKIELQPDAKEELQKIQEELKTLLSAEKTDMQAIQEKIEVYNGHATNIWNDYLTNIDDVENSQYRWVIHNLTKGELEGDFRNKYMSTSLMTNNAMGKYGNSDYGLIIKPKHIVCASYRDTYTLNTRDDEENLFNIRPPLMLPQEIEDICIQQTIEENGEMLNYETTPIYSELVVDDYEIEGIYYISYGEKELAKDYERAKKVADERGLPLIERDISKYRKEHGLEPMTEDAKKKFCRNILYKCCNGNRELEKSYSSFSKSFIKDHFQEFYEKFMQLKENPEFSKEDILKTFSDITRGDIYFKEISQNIDEMYMSAEEKEELKMFQLEKEYGLVGINDGENLKRRLEKVISDGINYGANKEDLENIKKVMPQFEVFKKTYLQLRELGIEEQLYVGMDFANINYDKILERATSILEEKAKADGKQQEPIDESASEKLDENIEQPSEKIAIEETLDSNTRVNEFGEIIRENNTEESVIQNLDVIDEIAQRKIRKEIEQPKQILEKRNPEINLWMNRFNSWNSAINRVSQNVKAKFVKMKSDIVNAISEKLKERKQSDKQNYNQER